ncbi:MAG TPA: phosphoribosylformylglycinamidine synthase I [Candidatus Saccharimonadales bacterium]|nr:phosphoribosylformylglycinamidine synthase I [Candidatus Saccharimonadales bacterium]
MSGRLPTIGVLYGEGFNCNVETGTAIHLAGGRPRQIHVNELGNQSLVRDYQGLVLPGGFTKGDAVRAGIVVARQIEAGAGDQLRRFAGLGRPILGICNGFQILSALGMLPGGKIERRPTATLAHNASGVFECRWVDLGVRRDAASRLALFTVDNVVTLPVAHGEGRFRANPETLQNMKENGQILLQYSDSYGWPVSDYPNNPNGADYAIAAISCPNGNVMGSMPHFERFVDLEQHPNWRRPDFSIPEAHGLPFMRALVQMAS